MRSRESVAAGAVGSSAGSVPEHWDLDGVQVRLRRTEYLGTCPGYEVTLAEDGTVSLNGGHLIAVPGTHYGVPTYKGSTVQKKVEDSDDAWVYYLSREALWTHCR